MPIAALVPVLLNGSGGGGSAPSTGLSVLITIAGVDRTELVIACEWTDRIGEVGTASLTLIDPTSQYDPDVDFVPADGEVVEVTVDGVLRWAGQITRVSSTWLGHILGGQYQIEAQDWMHLPMREDFNGIVEAQLLVDTLFDLTDTGQALTQQGVTLAGGQAAGDTLGVITAPWWTVDQLLRHLATLSGFVWSITPAKVLEMWAPGVKSSFVTFSRANGNIIHTEFQRERLTYRNRQWVIFGPTGVQDVVDRWTGDGVTQDFDLHYAPATHPGSIVVGGVTRPVGVFGVDSMEWTFEANAGSGAVQYGRFRHVGTAPGAAVAITAPFAANFPNAVFVTDAAEVASWGRYGGTPAFIPDVVDFEEATAYGEALIRQNKPRPKHPTVITHELDVLPGYTAVVETPEVGIDETVFVHTRRVQLEKEGDGVRPTVSLECYSGTEQQQGSSELWRQLLGSGGGASGGGAVSGGGGGGGGGTVITNGLLRLHFGGWKQANPDLWQSTAGNGVAFDLPEGAEWSLVGAQVAGLILLRAHLMTDQGANGAVSVRLFNETDGVAASDWTPDVTASTLTYTSVFCTLAAAEKVYKVQVRISGSNWATTNFAPWCVTLENRP
jgi:hypothetical protein